MAYFNVQTISLILVGLVNFVLGFLIYLREKENKSNLFFSLVALSVSWWVLTRALFEIFPVNNFIYVLGNFLYFSASLIPLFFVFFTYTFPSKKISLSKKKILFIIIPNLIIIWFILIPEFVVNNINQSVNGYKIITFGNGYFFYSLYIIYYFLWGFVNLIKKYKKSEGIIKIQLRYIFGGTFIATLFGVSTNLILPIFNSFRFFWLGPVMTIIMVVFIAYAIVKHHLLNIKIIATELFTGLIIIILFVDLFLARSPAEFFVKFGIFILVSIFGYLIIRNVLKMDRMMSELEAANIQLKKLDKAKSEFITIASHQLRAPLCAIKGYSSMLLEGSFGEIPKHARKPLDRILQSSVRLVLLIKDFLDLSRIERGKMEYDFQKINLKRLVEDIVEEFKTVNHKNLNLSFDVSPSLEGEKNKRDDFTVNIDQNKIRQVINNLIDNAMKYTPKGFVKVRLYKNPKKSAIVLQVTDSGIGMNRETLARIFEKFTRAKEGIFRINTEGIGLGLYVAKEIIKAHGGRVWAESPSPDTGKGSAFYLEIPTDFASKNSDKR